MDSVGPVIASSLAGVNQAERTASRDRPRRADEADRFRRALDQAELSVAQTEGEGAIRSAKGNDQEESRQDRREHVAYGPPSAPAPEGDEPPRIDLNG